MARNHQWQLTSPLQNHEAVEPEAAPVFSPLRVPMSLMPRRDKVPLRKARLLPLQQTPKLPVQSNGGEAVVVAAAAKAQTHPPSEGVEPSIVRVHKNEGDNPCSALVKESDPSSFSVARDASAADQLSVTTLAGNSSQTTAAHSDKLSAADYPSDPTRSASPSSAAAPSPLSSPCVLPSPTVCAADPLAL